MESEYTINFQGQPVVLLQSVSPACAQEPKKEIEMNNSALLGRMPLQHLSLNNMIQFGDHLLVDHPAIDDQHKSIFDLGTKVFENWRAGGSIDILRPAVEELSNLMHSHFTFEERVLDEIGYEDLKNHAAEHRTMRDELSTMHERLRHDKACHEGHEGLSLAPGWTVMQFILGVTVGHVANSDMSYSRALLANRHLILDLDSSSDAADGFWRGADAVYRRCLETGEASAVRSAARLQARLTRRARDRSAKPPTST